MHVKYLLCTSRYFKLVLISLIITKLQSNTNGGEHKANLALELILCTNLPLYRNEMGAP